MHQHSSLRETKNGQFFRYDAAPMSLSGGSKELEGLHTHFLLVDNHAAADFRSRFERRISSFDISGDGCRTPQVVLCIAGDAAMFEKVATALGGAAPVLVLKDTGGAALDIFKYVLGDGFTWPPPNQVDEQRSRPLPSGGGGASEAEYAAMAKKWLPKILALGNSTGNNTTRQLGFYSISEDSTDLATTIQKAMLNDCPDARQEVRYTWIVERSPSLSPLSSPPPLPPLSLTSPFDPPLAGAPRRQVERADDLAREARGDGARSQREREHRPRYRRR